MHTVLMAPPHIGGWLQWAQNILRRDMDVSQAQQFGLIRKVDSESLLQDATNKSSTTAINSWRGRIAAPVGMQDSVC
jgi:hypothetical protein